MPNLLSLCDIILRSYKLYTANAEQHDSVTTEFMSSLKKKFIQKRQQLNHHTTPFNANRKQLCANPLYQCPLFISSAAGFGLSVGSRSLKVRIVWTPIRDVVW